MNRYIEALEARIYQEALCLWPEISDTPELSEASLLPLADPLLGDLGSDYPRRLAARLKLDAQKVLERLVARLSSDFPADALSDNAFLNLRLHEIGPAVFPFAGMERFAGPARHPHVVVVPAAAFSLDLWGKLRLCSAALLQFVTLRDLGREAAFFAGEGLLVDYHDKCEWSDLMRRLLSFLPDSHQNGNVRQVAGAQTLQRFQLPQAQVTFWVPPRALSSFSPFGWFGDCAFQRSLVATCSPQPRWLGPVEAEVAFEELYSWSDARLAGLVFHLAGPNSAPEVDLCVPSVNEKCNINWYLQASLERLERYRDILNSIPDKQGLKVERGPAGQLALRAGFLGGFYQMVADRGATGEFVQVLFELLSSVNAWLNRGGRAGAPLEVEEALLMRGAQVLLCDVVARCSLLRASGQYSAF